MRGRKHVAPFAQYSPNTSGPSSSPSVEPTQAPAPFEIAERAQEAAELLREIVEIALAAGPSGVSRALLAAQACASLGARVLRDPQNPPKPEELVRQLFEALGATYV